MEATAQNKVKTPGNIRKGTKIFGVWEVLSTYGRISNLEALNGQHKMANGKRLRTNRLAAIINTLEYKYGVHCTRERVNWYDGEYKDFVYHFTQPTLPLDGPTIKQETLF